MEITFKFDKTEAATDSEWQFRISHKSPDKVIGDQSFELSSVDIPITVGESSSGQADNSLEETASTKPVTRRVTDTPVITMCVVPDRSWRICCA